MVAFYVYKPTEEFVHKVVGKELVFVGLKCIETLLVCIYVTIGKVQAHWHVQKLESIELRCATLVGYATVVTEVEQCLQIESFACNFIYLFQQTVGIVNGVHIV